MNDPRAESRLGRFELVCEAFNQASPERQQKALALLNEEDRKTFLTGCALYRLFTEPERYRAMKEAMAETLYNEFTKEDNDE